MSRRRNKHTPPRPPDDAIVVTTYAGLARYLDRFAAGALDLLLLLGRHGTGKTEGVRRALGIAGGGEGDGTGGAARGLYVEGHAQPYGLYRQLWEHRDLPVVLDDLDRLYADPDTIRLLKPLCSGAAEKRISWVSNITLQRDGVPPRFTTRSTVVLVANEWRTLNANVRALEDRAIVIHFDPSNEEVHRQVGRWFNDAEVYGFVGEHLPRVPAVSMRHYDKGRRLRLAGFADWRGSLLQMMLADRGVAALAGLLLDASLTTEKQRVETFVRTTGLSRATYYRLKRVGRARASVSSQTPGQA